MGEAIASSVASNLVSKLGEYLIAPIGRQFGYVLCYKSYVKDLENGVKELETARERVQHSVQEAENNGKPIEDDIEKWLESVKEETEKVDDLLKRGKTAKDGCLRGWLPNPAVRHPIGRKVKKITKVIQGLHEKSQNNNFQKVYYENPPIGIVAASTSAARSVDKKEDVLESRAKITEDVMKAIIDDNVCVIGVYGTGGVGKSKLLKDIERRVKEENLFYEVATAKVSCNPDLKRIQGEIAYAIGLKLMNEETALGRADLLCKRLESDPKKNILIILDDLWDKLELKDIGIPCEDGNKVRGCKLLLTSRNRDVLRTHMDSDREFQLNVLKHGEARRLFERIVGDKVNNIELEPWVDGAVKNCGGLPLSIVSLAKRLKHKDLAAWRNASTNRDLSNVKSLVELSYNDLKDERIRSLFLVCALTSGRISTRHSLLYCMGLGLFKNFSKTIQNARDRLIDDLHSLQDSSLLLESDGMEWFRMHDIFVDVAISMHDKFMDMEWNALVGKKDHGFKEWSEDELRKCTAISFSFVGIDELPEKLDCPNLRMLLLLENNTSLKVPKSFFQSMEKLQVLHFAGLSFTSLTSSIQFLEHLKSLSLASCNLEDVTVLGKLKGLQFLSFAWSTIARLPKEIGELTELRFLDLTCCFKLEIIEPGMLGRLVNLEELHIDSFHQWEAKDEAPRSNASLIELKNMKKLRTLDIAIPHSTNLSSDLPFGNLNEHKIKIGGIAYWWGQYKESRTLELKLDSGNLLDEVWMQECLGRTQDLRLDGLQDGGDSIHDLRTEGFEELKHLHVKNNLSFKYVVDSSRCPAFTRLESLVLKNLNLEKICHDRLAAESFSKLKIVKLENCGEIKQLFPSSMETIFLQLEEIQITRCHLMQQVVADAEVEECRDEIDDDANPKSWKLRRLTLQNLPAMTSFCKTRDHSEAFLDGQQVSLPRLESLTLSKLPKLKDIWNLQFPSDVSNLKLLNIEDCAFLLSIIPSNLLIKLQSLEAITVKRCSVLQEIFNLEGLTNSGDVEILSQLTRLTLSELPSLEHIWNKNPRRESCFRNLRALKVQNCENLRFLFSSSMAKALGHIMEIEIASCKLMEEVMDVQEEESEEAATTDTLEFPQLTSLSLKELPNLRTFSYGKHYIHCPSLTRLTISGCPKMMTFSSFEEKQQSITDDAGLQQAFGRVNSSLSLPVFFNEKVLFPSLEELKLSSMCELKRIWHNQFHGQSFCKLASLTLELCENLSRVFPSNSMDRLRSLNKIEVVRCASLEALFEPVSLTTEKRQKPLVLSALKNLKLLNLPRLTDILKSDCKVTLAFPSLMEVNVRHCHSLPHLFSSALAITLDKLVVLDVSCCNNLRSIIMMENGNGNFVATLKFRHLSTLKLGDLENLVSFRSMSCAGDGLHPLFDEKLAFPKLEELHIERVQQKELWNKKIIAESFCRLKVLKVKQCHNLMNVIPSFMWKRVVHRMEHLTVESCNLIEDIYMLEGLGVMEREAAKSSPTRASCVLIEEIMDMQQEESKESATSDTLEFPMLTSLSLVELPNLRTFAYGKYCIHCPSLTKLTISGCLKMMTFSSFKGKQRSITIDTSVQQAFGCINSGLSLPSFFNEKVVLPSLEELKLSSMCQLKRIWHNQLHGQSFCKLASLTVELCENLSHVFPSNSMERLQSLNKIEVVGCPSLEALFELVSLGSEKREKPLVLSALNKMKLLNLPRLRDILKSDYEVTLAFPSLMEVNVRRCHSLPYLFSSATAKTLDKLAILDVSCCNNLRGVIAMEEGKGKTIETFKFCQLSTLKVVNLENLLCFNSESCAGDGFHPLFDEKLAFPKLKKLHVEGVQQKELWNNEILVESFCCLKVLKVKQCHNLMNVIPSFMGKRLLRCMESLTIEKCPRLRNLFTMSMAKSLGQLQYLGLGGCGEMEYIVAKEEEKPEEAANRIVIPQLVTLYIHNMPNLRSFCQGKHISEWPSLKEFTVEDCKAVEAILGDANCRKLEDSIPTQQPLLLVEKVEFPNMESMKISHMDNVEKIWLDDLASNAFSKLKTLVVEYCEKLSSIFSSCTMLTRFQNLEKITVTNCGSLEVVFHIQEFNFSETPSTSTFELRELVLTRLPKMKHVWSGLPQGSLTFGRLRCMKVVECERLNSLFPSLMAKSMTQLEELLVRDCGAEEIIAEEDGVGMNAGDLFFPRLTDLRLLELPKLRCFYKNSHTSTWPLLKQLRVRHCGKMRAFSFAYEIESCQDTIIGKDQPALFSFEKVIPHLEGSTLTREDVKMLQQHSIFDHLRELSLGCYHDENVAFPSNFLLQRFPNLETLSVTCSSFKEVFPEDASGHGGATSYGGLTDVDKPPKELGNLKRFYLKKLCNLRRVWKDGSLMAELLNQIEVLWVYECPSLSIVLPSPTSFQRLTHLRVTGCASLVHMGTCSAVTSLVHLTRLSLRNCGAMKDVVTDDRNGAEDISFPKLEELILDGLPKLESFSPTNCAFRFPSLVRIIVTQCPKINIFCKGALRTPKLDKVLLSKKDDEGRWEGDLNTTIQSLST